LGEVKKGYYDEAMKNCTFGEHPAVLTKSDLLANESIYWPIPDLASESEQITHLEHGSYERRPASLVCFQLHFRFNSEGSSRFSSSEVHMTFTGAQGASSGQSNLTSTPVVKIVKPKQLRGRITPVKTSRETSLGPVAASLAGLGASASFKKVEEFSKDYSMQVRGQIWTSGSHPNVVGNIVTWKVTENRKQAEGIATELTLGVIVSHDGAPFHGTMKIKASTTYSRIFWWPWSETNPLIFRPTVSLGPAVGVSSFEDMTDEHWETLGVGF
jgi:hypothetical protein